ncbi:MAG: N-acetylmuramoyl-L-alanine amidase [Bryobacterales bacterium]|nr:N-acetylmuramoyl-L-alanine amidase [Bryobacterales bacterium]
MLHLPRKEHGWIHPRTRPWLGRFTLCSFAVMLLSTIPGAARAENSAELHHVTAVRFWSLSGVTRIAIETDGDFQLKSDHLENPDRLFYDLWGTRPVLSQKILTVIPVSDRILRQIRVAEPQRNVTRVVLDLETPAEATVSRLENPYRLIIELRAPAEIHNSTESRAPDGAIQTTSIPAKIPPAVEAPVRAAEVNPDAPSVLLSRRDPPSAPKELAVNYKTGSDAPAASSLGVLAKTPSSAIGVASKNSLPSNETAFPAKRNASGDRSMIRVLGLKVGRIVIDPGHGGHDTGTIGPQGLREKDLVLDVAQRLGRLIETRMGSEVIFTRSDDTFIPLEQRTEIANDAEADLFISIHANSSPLRSTAGVETYYLNFTTSRSALDLASRENSGSEMTVYDLQGLLEKIALKDKVEESREFATRVQTALYTLSAKTADARSRDRGVKKAPFVVLIGATMPSVLAEIGFISNEHDESVMRREEYRQRTAEALYKGISSYANSLSHFQVAQRH